MTAMFGAATSSSPDPAGSVLRKLARLEEQGAWPNGSRHLGIDAIGVLVLVGLARSQRDPSWLDRAEDLVREVDRVLRRRRGYRAGEGALRDLQSFRELALWVFALRVLGDERPGHAGRSLEIVREIHRAFVAPGIGVHATRGEDLDHSRPEGTFGRLDPMRGAVVWRLVDPVALADEIAEMDRLVESAAPRLRVERDVSAGTALWLSHFFPEESWCRALRDRALVVLDRIWMESKGCFARSLQARASRRALGNYAITLGLQAHGLHRERVDRAHAFWETQPWRGLDRGLAPRLMACAALLPEAMIQPLESFAPGAVGRSAVSAAGAP